MECSEVAPECAQPPPSTPSTSPQTAADAAPSGSCPPCNVESQLRELSEQVLCLQGQVAELTHQVEGQRAFRQQLVQEKDLDTIIDALDAKVQKDIKQCSISAVEALDRKMEEDIAPALDALVGRVEERYKECTTNFSLLVDDLERRLADEMSHLTGSLHSEQQSLRGELRGAAEALEDLQQTSTELQEALQQGSAEDQIRFEDLHRLLVTSIEDVEVQTQQKLSDLMQTIETWCEMRFAEELEQAMQRLGDGAGAAAGGARSKGGAADQLEELKQRLAEQEQEQDLKRELCQASVLETLRKELGSVSQGLTASLRESQEDVEGKVREALLSLCAMRADLAEVVVRLAEGPAGEAALKAAAYPGAETKAGTGSAGSEHRREPDALARALNALRRKSPCREKLGEPQGKGKRPPSAAQEEPRVLHPEDPGRARAGVCTPQRSARPSADTVARLPQDWSTEPPTEVGSRSLCTRSPLRAPRAAMALSPARARCAQPA